MSKLWLLLAEKGKWASIIGFLMALPINIWFVVVFFMSNEFTDGDLKAALVVNAIAMMWFILPSRVKISGKNFTMEVDD